MLALLLSSLGLKLLYTIVCSSVDTVTYRTSDSSLLWMTERAKTLNNNDNNNNNNNNNNNSGPPRLQVIGDLPWGPKWPGPRWFRPWGPKCPRTEVALYQMMIPSPRSSGTVCKKMTRVHPWPQEYAVTSSTVDGGAGCRHTTPGDSVRSTTHRRQRQLPVTRSAVTGSASQCPKLHSGVCRKGQWWRENWTIINCFHSSRQQCNILRRCCDGSWSVTVATHVLAIYWRSTYTVDARTTRP